MKRSIFFALFACILVSNSEWRLLWSRCRPWPLTQMRWTHCRWMRQSLTLCTIVYSAWKPFELYRIEKHITLAEFPCRMWSRLVAWRMRLPLRLPRKRLWNPLSRTSFGAFLKSISVFMEVLLSKSVVCNINYIMIYTGFYRLYIDTWDTHPLCAALDFFSRKQAVSQPKKHIHEGVPLHSFVWTTANSDSVLRALSAAFHACWWFGPCFFPIYIGQKNNPNFIFQMVWNHQPALITKDF